MRTNALSFSRPGHILLRWLAFAAFTGLLASCKSSNVTAEAPDATGAMQTLPRKLSTINLPLSFNIKQLEGKLNQQLSGVLYKDDKLEDDNLKLTVTKLGNIVMGADNNKITFSIPLNVWALGRAEWQPCSFCPKLSQSQSTSFDVNVTTETQLSLTENWQIATKTSTKYTWGNKKPSLDIGPVSIPLSGVVDLALAPYMDDLNSQIDKELQKRLDLSSYVRQAWTDVQQPMLLDKNMGLWLKVSPQEIRISPMQMKSNVVSFRVGISSFIDVISGEKPPVNLNRTLPKLVTDPNIPDNVQIGLVGSISYPKATELAKKQVLGQTFAFDDNKYQVLVNDLDISPLGNKLLVKMYMTAKNKKGKKTNGLVYIEGTPYYDAATSTVRVKDFDYNVKTKNLLLKSASWLVNQTFLGQVEKKLTFPMDQYINDAQKQLQQTLTGTRLSDNALLKGSLTKLNPEGIYLTPDGIKAVVNAEGKVSVVVDKL